jgi:hypothetical protein
MRRIQFSICMERNKEIIKRSYFWDIAISMLLKADVSREYVTSIFRVEE